MPSSLADYADFARDEVMKRGPGDSMRVHAAGWRYVLPGIYNAGGPAGGVFEVTAIAVSRWEFLGGLYSGEALRNTDVAHAVAYARRPT
jgi:hypothetical protein